MPDEASDISDLQSDYILPFLKIQIPISTV